MKCNYKCCCKYLDNCCAAKSVVVELHQQLQWARWCGTGSWWGWPWHWTNEQWWCLHWQLWSWYRQRWWGGLYRYTALMRLHLIYTLMLVFNHTASALEWLLVFCRTRYENTMIKPSSILSRFIALAAGPSRDMKWCLAFLASRPHSNNTQHYYSWHLEIIISRTRLNTIISIQVPIYRNVICQIPTNNDAWLPVMDEMDVMLCQPCHCLSQVSKLWTVLMSWN